MAYIFWNYQNYLRSKNNFACTYSFFKTVNSLMKNKKSSSREFSSRTPKSWFKIKRKTYDIVSVHKVSPRRSVPENIMKPDYALSGVPNELETIEILNETELKSMKQSCALAKFVLEQVGRHVAVGVSTDELDAIAHNLCVNHGAYPSPLNYRGYPKSICTSVNNVACHGIPDDRKLISGDIISIDISVFYSGYHGDCAATFKVGEVDQNGEKLIEVTSHCLSSAIEICRPNLSFCQIGKTISSIAKQHGFSVIPAFCGHGIGSSFHSPPSILHYDNDEEGKMEKGMIFTIEPIICENKPDIVILEDGWTAITEDDGRSAQFEHTLLITESGAEILTVADAFENFKK